MKIDIAICDRCGHVFKWGEHIHIITPDKDIGMPASVVQHICDKCSEEWHKEKKSRKDAEVQSENTAKELLRRACDGLLVIYEREGFDYGTGDTYDECRKFLAEHEVPEVLGGERIE